MLLSIGFWFLFGTNPERMVCILAGERAFLHTRLNIVIYAIARVLMACNVPLGI